MAEPPLLAGVELGGTKCVALIGTGPQHIHARTSVATGSDPQATLTRLRGIIAGWQRQFGPIDAFGLSSFGPLELDPSRANHGCITSTPKPGWRDTPVLASFALPVPTGFDTDVSAAARAEGRWGAAQGLRDYAYVTVGTGIGVGLMVDGRPARGFAHPEMGHIRIVRRAGDDWPGTCPFHGDCLEGLASGPAIAQRRGRPAGELPADDPVWELEVHALAQLLHTLVLATAPRRILLGGGVIEGQPQVLARLRPALQRSLNGYVLAAELSASIDEYVRAPGLGALAGPLGALAIAADALAADA